MSKTILFFGNERLATGVSTNTPVLRGLIDNGYKVAAVVIAQNEIDKSRQARHLEIADIAKKHNIPVISPENLIKTKSELESYGAEVAVLVAYGKLVPGEIIDIFPKGIINIHPSLLPLHRGSTPIESVILDGSVETGVSLMKLVEKMDAGPVYAQEKVALDSRETKQALADKLSEIGSKLVLDNLPGIIKGTHDSTPQNENLATEDQHIQKEDSLLDFTKSAETLEREIRAYAGWPRSRTKLNNFEVIVTSAHVSDGTGNSGALLIDKKSLGIQTSKGLLVIDTLIPAGKKEMSAAAFLAGYKID